MFASSSNREDVVCQNDVEHARPNLALDGPSVIAYAEAICLAPLGGHVADVYLERAAPANRLGEPCTSRFGRMLVNRLPGPSTITSAARIAFTASG